jgi:Fe-S cluster assembly iron-binding protein IscA
MRTSLQNFHEEVDMFEITEKASEMVKDFLKDKEETPSIRIMLSQGG